MNTNLIVVAVTDGDEEEFSRMRRSQGGLVPLHLCGVVGACKNIILFCGFMLHSRRGEEDE